MGGPPSGGTGIPAGCSGGFFSPFRGNGSSMRLFFRRSSAGTKPSAPENSGTLFPAESSATATAELPPPVEEAKAPERAVEVSLAEKSQPDDSVLAESLRSIVFAPKKDLVKASELPSAANVLAELFADAPVDAADDEKASEPV